MGEDYLETITCPIIIKPEDLRGLTAERDKARQDLAKLVENLEARGIIF